MLGLLYASDEGHVDLREAADRIAAREYETDEESLTKAEHQRVYISLYQTHLPKLADYDIVEYNATGRIELQPRAHVLRQFVAEGLPLEERITVGEESPSEEDDSGGVLSRLLYR